ncbi:DUF1453 domain-containing protein [Streptomyces sp. PTD5-9]|uniref:DUF1453 domain-containing protein n=1 Tax=Streptomyces sp. PTD5-9 TaxID=3120150 RepID=UPI00300B1021
MSGFVDVLVAIAVVAFVVIRQFSARRLSDDRRWWVLPGVLLVMSLRQPGLVDPRHEALSAAVLGAELVVALATGAAWGWTSRLWREADGSLWSRGGKATVLVWTAGLALRVLLYGTAAALGVHQGRSALLSTLAVTLAARGGVLMWRAGRPGTAYGASGDEASSRPRRKDRV